MAKDFDQKRIDASRAKAIMGDPLINAFFTDFEQELWQAWTASKDSEERRRERVWLMHKTLEKFKQHFHSYITDYKIAESLLPEEEKE